MVVREDLRVISALVAYVVPAAGVTCRSAMFASAVGSLLPAYMVPSAFVVLDAFPLTANGKLDRRALPAPVFEARCSGRRRRRWKRSWRRRLREVLGVERVGVDDDFFALGGNSLMATQVASRLGAGVGYDGAGAGVVRGVDR